MKKINIILFLLFGPLLCMGQQINKAEYFIDYDPGFGLANPVTISSPGNDLTAGFTASVQSLTEGFHYLGIRARDDLGRWGHISQRIFYIFKMQAAGDMEINKAEYFIDSDPGFGLASPVNINSPGSDLSIDFTASLQSLAEGFHYLGIRAQDKSGRWGQLSQRVFYVFNVQSATAREIIGVEYFIDNDPGFGNGTAISPTSSDTDLTVDFDIDLSGLNSGDHVLYIRCKDALGRWGLTYAQGFAYTATGLGENAIEPWLKIYPNPNAGTFCIEFADIQKGPLKFNISNLDGKKVYENESFNGNNPLVVDLPAGIYILKIESDNKQFIQRLIIRK